MHAILDADRTRTALPLIERITSGNAVALREVAGLAAAWDALEQPQTAIGSGRFFLCVCTVSEQTAVLLSGACR